MIISYIHINIHSLSPRVVGVLDTNTCRAKYKYGFNDHQTAQADDRLLRETRVIVL